MIVGGKSLVLSMHDSLIPHTLLMCHENGCGIWPHLLIAYLRSGREATVSSPEFVHGSLLYSVVIVTWYTPSCLI